MVALRLLEEILQRVEYTSAHWPSHLRFVDGLFNVRFGTSQARLFLWRIKLVTFSFSYVYRSALHTQE